MSDNDPIQHRRPGRPPLRSEAETRAVIVAAAANAFLGSGYIRTGVDTIAKAAADMTGTTVQHELIGSAAGWMNWLLKVLVTTIARLPALLRPARW